MTVVGEAIAGASPAQIEASLLVGIILVGAWYAYLKKLFR